MTADEQQDTVELLTANALMKVVRRLQVEYGVPIHEASILVSAVLPKCGKLLQLWTKRKD
jgi:hypothetical protein